MEKYVDILKNPNRDEEVSDDEIPELELESSNVDSNELDELLKDEICELNIQPKVINLNTFIDDKINVALGEIREIDDMAKNMGMPNLMSMVQQMTGVMFGSLNKNGPKTTKREAREPFDTLGENSDIRSEIFRCVLSGDMFLVIQGISSGKGPLFSYVVNSSSSDVWDWGECVREEATKICELHKSDTVNSPEFKLSFANMCRHIYFILLHKLNSDQNTILCNLAKCNYASINDAYHALYSSINNVLH